MNVLKEGELEFTFGGDWQAEKFDQPGASWPKGISPVDFIAEGQAELVLMEIKDPSASAIPAKNRQDFIAKMQTKELIYEELVPKARSSYGFLHLMKRDAKPMRYVVVIGTENLSIQPVLLMQLTDRLKARLTQETNTAWKLQYISNCSVVSVADLGKALSGCSASRIP